VGWFGIAAMIAFCGVAAAATSDPTLSVALLKTMHLAVWLSVPAGLVAVFTGTVLSLGTSWGVLRHWWVVAKGVISILVMTTDVVVVATVTSDAATTGTAPRALVDSTIAHFVVLAAATALSIFKPRGRTPFGRSRGARTTQGAAAGRPEGRERAGPIVGRG
jgi:hypothetical protein